MLPPRNGEQVARDQDYKTGDMCFVYASSPPDSEYEGCFLRDWFPEVVHFIGKTGGTKPFVMYLVTQKAFLRSK